MEVQGSEEKVREKFDSLLVSVKEAADEAIGRGQDDEFRVPLMLASERLAEAKQLLRRLEQLRRSRKNWQKAVEDEQSE
jgi:hypothetical protein